VINNTSQRLGYRFVTARQSAPVGSGPAKPVPALRRRAVLLLPLLMVAYPARAHSELHQSSPAAGAVLHEAPTQIELHFKERVQLTALRLYREGGDEIPLPRRPIRAATQENIALPPLAPGAYRAEWRIISADGHPVGGVIPFRIVGSARP
jgi:methionine-rich copper-binding protein CopC